MDLKVLIATPFFPPVVNGTSIYVYRLVKGLTDRGIYVRVHTIGTKLSKAALDLESDDLDIVTFDGFRAFSNEQPISLSYVASTIKMSDSFDIVHVHDSPKVSNDILIFALKNLRADKPLLFTLHGGLMSTPAYEWRDISSLAHKTFSKVYWSLGILQKAILTADHLIAVNPLQAKLLSEMCDPQKVSMIPEAIPSYYFADKPNFVEDQKLKILFIGRMAEDKGIKDLLYAINEITNTPCSRRNVELVCIGQDHGYLHKALEIVDALKLNNVVRILGSLPEYEKLKYLSRCDILVLPSYYEAFGLPILEAMAMGKPVIATETIGAKFLVKEGVTGFLVKIGDTKSVANSLMRFLNEPQLKREMGERALEYAHKFHMNNMIEDHIKLYRTICSPN